MLDNDQQQQGGTAVIVRPEGETLLARFGSRREIAEFADRISRTIPVRMTGGNVRRMKDAEACKLAEASLAHGLDPHLGQIYLVVDSKGIPNIVVGPAGYEVHATRQMQEQGGGNWWPEFEIIAEQGERDGLLIPAGAIAYRCRLYDTQTMRTYTEAIKAAQAAGGKWDQIIMIFGSHPYTEGIGIYKPDNSYQDKQWPPHEHARKRALHSALKKRFSLGFPGLSDGDLADEFTGPLHTPAREVPAEPSRAADDQPATDQGGDPAEFEHAPEAPEPPPPGDQAQAPIDYTDPAQVAKAIEAEQAKAPTQARGRAAAKQPARPAGQQQRGASRAQAQAPARTAAQQAAIDAESKRRLFSGDSNG